MPDKPTTPSRRVRVQVAARASVDERTVRHYWLEPQRLHPLYARAVKDALRALGITDPHAAVRQ